VTTVVLRTSNFLFLRSDLERRGVVTADCPSGFDESRGLDQVDIGTLVVIGRLAPELEDDKEGGVVTSFETERPKVRGFGTVMAGSKVSEGSGISFELMEPGGIGLIGVKHIDVAEVRGALAEGEVATAWSLIT